MAHGEFGLWPREKNEPAKHKSLQITMSLSEWDDLFALAGGGSTLKSTDANDEELNVSSKAEKRKSSPSFSSVAPKSSRKKAKPSSAYNDFVSKRSSNLIQLPSNLTYGSSLIDGSKCPGVKFSTKNAAKPCKKCGFSRFRHTIQPIKSDKELEFFCCLRNLRHVAFLYIKEKNEKLQSDICSFAKMLRKVKRTLPAHNDYAQLHLKLDDLLKRLQTFPKSCTTQPTEGVVRVIMECDAVYYYLYYLQTTNVSKQNDFVPHPVFYFGETLDELDDAKNHCLRRIKHFENDSLRKRFSLNCRPLEEDPLTVIHHVRFLETVQLFHLSGWLTANETESQFRLAARHPVGPGIYERHETPAPALLRDWRDSCRDFLTHLYSYATIPRSLLHQMKNFVGKERVVEVGAGTGYISSLLRKVGVNVDAYDSRPGKQNEYHGSTPTFIPISEGDAAAVMDRQQQPFVLLICYPPPDSSMAVDTLQKFLEKGGTKIIHVGEFYGLTGTLAFTDLLAKKCVCVKRFECPTWGTDAAWMTLWERQRSVGSHATLLPCTICGEESTKRFRFARYLQYCSSTCWEMSTKQNLSAFLEFGSVAKLPDMPEFSEETAFLSIGNTPNKNPPNRKKKST